MAGNRFRPGDQVLWLKNASGGYVFPVLAKVVAVTPKRVTIQADDPEEKGEGVVTRHVRPASLQPKAERAAPARRSRGVSRSMRSSKNPSTAFETFEGRYPHISSWVQDGWIEIGHDDCGRPFLRAMDIGGVVWEGEGPYTSMDEALQALEEGIAEWLEEHG
jgi:hypothetical protein